MEEERKAMMSGSERLVMNSMILLGLGYLAPYNSVLTAVDYFSDKFGSDIEYYVAAALVCPNVVFLALSVMFGLPWSERTCIIGGFGILLAGSMAMPFIEQAWILLVVSFAMGMSTAMTQGTLFSICGLLGPQHTAALTIGTGCAGTVICLIRMATKSAPSEWTSVLAFFIFSSVLCVACIVDFKCIVENSEYMLKCRGKTASQAKNDSLREPLAKAEEGEDNNDDDNDDDEVKEKISNTQIAKQAIRGIISVVLVFLVTLAIFPGIISEMKSSHVSSDWWSLILFTAFNFTDTVGKFSAGQFQVLHLNGLLSWSVLRLVFVPVFILCVNPDYIKWEWLQSVLVILFGLSNGYLGTLAMMLGPQQVSQEQSGRAGLIMVFFLTTGLAVGSWVGVGLKQLMDHTDL